MSSEAGRPIRLGVAGLGRAFTLMLPTFIADRRIELVAAFDTRAEARRQFATDFGMPTHEDFEGLLDDPGIDAVYVASPHQFHAQQAAALLARGKHVLVEKPMALTLADCDTMIAAADASQRHLIVGHCHSFDAPYLRTRELVRSGRFGAVRMLHSINYTDFLYRPRRPEELQTSEGGGVVFSQAAHQVDVLRLLACAEPTRVRAMTGAWDPKRPTEGAYSAMLWFANGAFASMTYSGYAHFDSDEWCGWIGEMGQRRQQSVYGAARQRLKAFASVTSEAALKNAATYGGPDYRPPVPHAEDGPKSYQHFGPLIVSCDGADLRPLPYAVIVYGHDRQERIALPRAVVPREEVIDELWAAVRTGTPPLHDGRWARGTLAVCLAMLRSAREQRDVELPIQENAR